jgi:hypothetical protein
METDVSEGIYDAINVNVRINYEDEVTVSSKRGKWLEEITRT